MNYLLEILVVGSLSTNCYILSEKNSKKTLIIDPGDDAEVIIETIENSNLKPSGIVNTHGHADHIGANKKLKDKYKVPLYIHKDDADYLTNPSKNVSGLLGLPLISPKADILLKNGDIIELGELKIKVIHTPGHSPGGINLMVEDLLITGDTLFNSGIGRCDLPGGNGKTLIKSLEVYKTLPGNLKVFPGHGPDSTLKTELESNPYLNGEY